MAVNLFIVTGEGDSCGSIPDVCGLSVELLLSPVKGGVGGIRDDRALGFE